MLYSYPREKQETIYEYILKQIKNLHLEKQVHLWNIILLSPDLFFHKSKDLNILYLMTVKRLITFDSSTTKRTLALDMMALIISYYKKEQYLRELNDKKNENVMNELNGTTNDSSVVPVSETKEAEKPAPNKDESILFSTDVSYISMENPELFFRKSKMILNYLIYFSYIFISAGEVPFLRRTLNIAEDLFRISPNVSIPLEENIKASTNNTPFSNPDMRFLSLSRQTGMYS